MLATVVLLDVDGQPFDHWQGGTTPAGWQALLDWAATFGGARRWGLEGSGQYGRGLVQFLVRQGEPVVEVNPRLTVLGRCGRGSQAKNDLRAAAAIAAVVQAQGTRLPQLQPDDAMVAPLEVSSAGRKRHRLNRGANANSMRSSVAWPAPSCAAVPKRKPMRRLGKREAEVLRALKRLIACRVYQRWQRCLALLAATDSVVQLT